MMNVPGDMRDRYLTRRRQELRECKESLDSGNLIFLEKVGHRLKGNGVTFGHPELSAIGKKLEEAARAGNVAEIEPVVRELELWVEAQA